MDLGSAAPVTSRSKYVLDPSVQSSSSYGQSSNMYAPPSQTFGIQPNQTFGAQSNQTFGVQQQPTYGAPFNQPLSNQPIGNMNQSSILNPPSVSTFAPGLPPIELAQQAIQQPIQKNPTPPPGWNDPPVLKSTRPVSVR